MIINPVAITNFDRTNRELEAFWLFSMFVAGKNSDFAAKKLNALMAKFGPEAEPIYQMGAMSPEKIEALLRSVKVGQYGRLTKAIVGSCGLDLRTVTVQQLMAIHGVGPKTARFFILHSRRDAGCAVLDTHVLKFLRDNGYPLAPKSTPNPKNYGVWETIFLNICKLNYPDQSIADVDLRIWTEYSGRA